MLKQPGIISQARMTSTRLPGKILKKVGGKTLLEYHVERLKWSGLPVVIATTTNKTDDPVVELCEQLKVPTFRGDENDVLSRYFGAVQKFNFDPVVRVTSDCPLIDGRLIFEGMHQYLVQAEPNLYLSNCLDRTYPRGFDYEILSEEMLKEAFDQATALPEREHVTPYWHQNQHGKAKFRSMTRSTDMSAYRLTVDVAEDFELIEKLILEFGCAEKSEAEICHVLEQHPELQKINAHIEQKKL